MMQESHLRRNCKTQAQRYEKKHSMHATQASLASSRYFLTLATFHVSIDCCMYKVHNLFAGDQLFLNRAQAHHTIGFTFWCDSLYGRDGFPDVTQRLSTPNTSICSIQPHHRHALRGLEVLYPEGDEGGGPRLP